MTKSSVFVICLIFNVILLLFVPSIQCVSHSGSSSSSSQHCKELNQWNCYSAKNDGIFCNSKDQSKTEIRWYYDKGSCRKFNYKGCNGNRNRFCTKDVCLKRCEGE